MSKQIEAQIGCPNCGFKFPMKLYRSIWIEFPENLELVLSDEINTGTCPSCKSRFHVPFPFLCTNVQKGVAVWYEPHHDPEIDKDMIRYIKEFGPNSFYAKAPRINNWPEFKRAVQKLHEETPNKSQAEASPDLLEKINNSNKSNDIKSPNTLLTPEARIIMVAKGLRSKGHPVPANIGEIQDFPFKNFESLKSSLQSGLFRLSRFSLNYNSDIFTILSTSAQKTAFWFSTLMLWVSPLIFVAMGIFHSWFWLPLVVISPYFGWKNGRSIYSNVLFTSAYQSEAIFCFLYFSRHIALISSDGSSILYSGQK
jgi:hypothetical protein